MLVLLILQWNLLLGVLRGGLLGGPRLKLTTAQDQVADGARHIHRRRDKEHRTPLGLELMCGEETDQVGSDDARDGAERVGEAEREASVAAGDVIVVDHEAGAVRAARASQAHCEQSNARVRYGARDKGEADHRTRRQHQAQGVEELAHVCLGQLARLDELVADNARYYCQQPEDNVGKSREATVRLDVKLENLLHVGGQLG